MEILNVSRKGTTKTTMSEEQMIQIQKEIQERELQQEQEAEFYNSPEQKELRYKAKVVELIRINYSNDDEIDLQNDCIDSLLQGLELRQEYIDYRNYVELSKDQAYLEVYEIERT